MSLIQPNKIFEDSILPKNQEAVEKIKSTIEEYLSKSESHEKEKYRNLFSQLELKSVVEEKTERHFEKLKADLQRILTIDPESMIYLAGNLEKLFCPTIIKRGKTDEIIDKRYDLNNTGVAVSNFVYDYFLKNYYPSRTTINPDNVINCFNVSIEKLFDWELAYETEPLHLEFYTWLFELEKQVEDKLVMIDIDKIESWLDCLKYPKGQMMNLNNGKIYEFNFGDVKAAYDYWNDDFKQAREAINGTNEAKDRSNKHFYSQAGMVLAYLNRSGKGNYQLAID